MNWRLWLKVAGGIFATILALVFAITVMGSQKERARQAQARARNTNGEAFAPPELFRAASPLSGLLESLDAIPASQLAMKSMAMEAEIVQNGSGPGLPLPGPIPQKLIRTGRVSLEVPDIDKATKALGSLVGGLGGYIADTRIHRNPSGSRSGAVSLRVPAAAYESVGSNIRTLGKVISESTNVQDVTKAYADLETRLRVKREALTRIRELLRTKAGNLKEVLEAEKETARITEEIEQVEGERRFFDHQISLSTIDVELNEPEPISLARPSSWWALSEALRDSTAMIAGSLAFMVRLVFIFLPWVGAGWCVLVCVRWIRARRKRREVAMESTSSAAEVPRVTED